MRWVSSAKEGMRRQRRFSPQAGVMMSVSFALTVKGICGCWSQVEASCF